MEVENHVATATTKLPASSLMDLDVDILLLILEQINLTDSEYGIKEQSPSSSSTFECQSQQYYDTHKTLPILRLVSKDLCRLATPIRYRTFKIKLSNLLDDISLRVVQHVKKCTRHAIFSQSVSWELVTTYYNSLPRVETISWNFNAFSEHWIENTFTPVPLSILRPNVRISLHATGFFHEFIHFVPPEFLANLKLGYWSIPTSSILQYQAPMKDYLVRAKNLRSLIYEVMDGDAGGEVLQLGRLLPNEQMPAVERLTLTCYSWFHTPREVKDSWDFRNLNFLDIRGIYLFKFLSSIVFEHFANLRVLRTGDLCWGKKENEEEREKGTVLLASFLQGLRNLEELYLTGRTYDLLGFDIFQNMKKLMKLEYRERALFRGRYPLSDLKNPKPRFRIERLKLLKDWCPVLEELKIDFDLPRADFPAYIDTLASFPSLNKVTLYTHLHEPDWHAGIGTKTSTTRLVNASYSMFEGASKNKISKLKIDLTINVGRFRRQIPNSPWGENYLGWVTGRTFSKHWKKAGGSKNCKT